MQDINWVLKKLDISIKNLAKIINEQGGRNPDKPIIYPEVCKNCNTPFFSNSQDHNMRINNGYPTLCPACRDVVRKEKKAAYAQNRLRRMKH